MKGGGGEKSEDVEKYLLGSREGGWLEHFSEDPES